MSLCTFAMIRYGLINYWNLGEVSVDSNTPAVHDMFIRFILAGSMVSLAVVGANFSGPITGSIFSSFPAVFLSIIYIAERRHGYTYARYIAPSILLSGMLNVSIFSLVTYHILPGTEQLVALAVSWIITAGISLILLQVTNVYDRK